MRSTAAGTTICCPSCASRAFACSTGTSWTKRPAPLRRSYFQREVDPLLTPIAIDPAHPFPRVLNKALCLALLLRPSGAAPARRFWAWSPCRARCPALSACPRADGSLRLPAAPGPDRAEPGRNVSRLRSAGARRLPRHPQLQPLLRRGRSALAAGDHSRRAAQPPQGRRGAPGDRDRRRPGDRRAAARQLRAGRGPGLPRRRPGQSLPAHVLLWRRAARRT